MMFEANQGQFEPGVDFIARGPGYTLGVQPGTMHLSLQRADSGRSVITQCRILGASQSAHGQAEKPLPTVMSYFLGNDPARWRSGVPTCAQVRYPQVYSGIDLIYYGNQRELEYDFIVAPGASPDQIRLEFPQPVTLDPATGELVLSLPGGELRHRAPVAYQESAGHRQPVACTYFLIGDRTIGFRPEAYDPTLPLTIDPLINYSTFFGGLDDEIGYASTTDASGATYLCGTTDGNAKFTSSPIDSSFNGPTGTLDAFILRLNLQGTTITNGTLIGGDGDDIPHAIAVDGSGNVYLAGKTGSPQNDPDFTLPRSSRPGYDTTHNGAFDAFVLRVNSNFTNVTYSTYLGGSSIDSAYGLAVTTDGKIWVSGSAGSSWTFNGAPASTGDTSFGGGTIAVDGFVARLNPDVASDTEGLGLEYFSYLGGSEVDESRGIALDTGGNLWITGFTAADDFPKVSPVQSNRGGVFDAFLMKMSPSGSILFSTYLGGSDSDYGDFVALDSNNQVYLTGVARSANFPVTTGAAQTQFGAGGTDGEGVIYGDVFVAKLAVGSAAFEYATYIGGNREDRPQGLVVDALGQAHVVGYTRSPNFPLQLSDSPALGGEQDGFLCKLTPDGKRLKVSTYVGGSAKDEAVGVGLLPQSLVRVVGTTYSADFFVTGNAAQSGKSAAGNPASPDLFFRAYGIEDTPPSTLSISRPGDNEAFITEVGPVPFYGQISDNGGGTGIDHVEIFVKKNSGGLYWNGVDFASNTPVNLGADFFPGSNTWSASGAIPNAGVGGLTLGLYTYSVIGYDKSGNIATAERVIEVDTVSPRVVISSPANGSFINTPVVVIGTAATAPDAVLQPERVNLTIFREGQWWDGDSWVGTSTQVHANVNNGTWAYPGNSTDPVAIAPTGDGIYGISVSATDSQGRPSRFIGGGQSNANSIVFSVDATPPQLSVVAPVADSSITAPPVTPAHFSGSASDSSGQPTVRLYLKNTDDNRWWNGLRWVDTEVAGAVLGSFPTTIANSWTFAKPPRLGRSMKNGNYEFKAVAEDQATNTTTVVRPFTVNWNPVWLRPQDELAKLLPAQDAPIGEGTVNAAIPFTYDPHRDIDDTRTHQPIAFGSDPNGGVYVISAMGNGNPSPIGVVIQKLGPGGWRHEHILVDGIEGWGDGGTEHFVGESGSTILYRFPSAFTGAVDSAGNTYVAFASGFQGNAANRVTAIKWDPSGQRVWRTESNTPTAGYIRKVQAYPDGSLLVVREVSTSPGSGGYTPVLQMADRVTAGGFGNLLVRGTLAGDFIEPVLPTYLFAETDPLNNTLFAIYDYQVGGDYPVYRLHRVNSSNAPAPVEPLVVDPAETPERWLGVKGDAEGNVYVLSSFDLSDTDRRLCLTRYDTSLQQVWRAFGPPRSMPSDSTSIAYPPVMHIGPWGITIAHGATSDGFHSEFPNEHGQITRFSAAGDMLWSRAAASGNGPKFGGETIPLMEVDANGSVLFLASFQGPNATYMTGYGKFSGIGDLQFLRNYGGDSSPFTATHTSLLQGTHMIALVNNSEVVQFTNPDNVLIPVLLDADKPEDTFVVAGSTARLDLINRGSLSIYQWRKENLSGTPVNISGATLDFLKIPNAALSDSGQYSVRAQNLVDSQTSRTATLTVLPAVGLAEALDTPGRTWTTGGHVPWVGFAPSGPVPSHDGVDAAMPGKPLDLDGAQISWIETTVTGPGSVSFWWKTSSFFGRDRAEFSVDGQIEAQLSGEQQGWNAVTIPFGEGEHTLRWAYHKYTRVQGDPASAGMDRMWLDEVVFAVPVSLEVALDDPGRTWTTTGDANWTGTTAPSHDGLHSALSGPIDDSQETSLETTVVGPGTASFWWKTSCDPVGDVAEFRVGNSLRANLNGESAWTFVSTPVPAGSHTLRWTYVKDFIFSQGQDRIWVDEFNFTGGSGGPEIAVERDPNHDLTDNIGYVDFGAALPGNNAVHTFTIRNTGSSQLSGLVITENGAHPDDFAFSALSSTTVNPGDTATFSVTFTPLSAGAKTAAIHVQNNDTDENTFDIELRGTGAIPITSWRQTHFGTSANSGTTADDADFDHDGIDNLLEFACGTLPGASSPEPWDLDPVDDSGFIYFTYTRNRLAMAEVGFQVKWTDDLASSWSSVDVYEYVLSDDGLSQQVVAIVPAGSSGHRFVRLEVTRF